MSWQTTVSKYDEGEVGRPYYLNTLIVMKDGEEWTRHEPFTVNPEHGKTIEGMIRKNTFDIPHPMKAALLNERRAEAKLSSGIVIRIWISDYPAPEYWNPTTVQKAQKRQEQGKAILYDANGGII